MRATPYLASLRIYEPLSAFDPADRLRWQNLERDETSFNREEELIIAAKEAANWKPDLYKAEVPFHGEGNLNLVTKNAERISEAIG